MTWQMFLVTYELHSPLHIGYHKIGNLQRTRYYVPARNVWGAVTEALTRRGFYTRDASEGDYGKIGDWVKRHCAFGYWFVREGDESLEPHYGEDGLRYGNLTAREFERLYLDAHVTTALDAATTSAQDGSLHEVEFIAPHTREGARTQIGGWIFLDDAARAVLRWDEWLSDLQIGGERRYGFGRLRNGKLTPAHKDGWQLDGARPRAQIEANTSLLAHTLTQNVDARGHIEPLIGRETRTDSRRFGMTLTRAQICWAPGTIVQHRATFEVSELGTWKRVV